MAITFNAARQTPLFAYVDISFADLVSGSTQAAIKLPPNSIVLHGAVVVTTAFNSATSDALTVGDATSAARYLGSTSVHAAGRTALVATGYAASVIEPAITVTYTGVGTAPTAGAMRLEVTYAIKGVAESTQG